MDIHSEKMYKKSFLNVLIPNKFKGATHSQDQKLHSETQMFLLMSKELV